jgi:hypothetical protein
MTARFAPALLLGALVLSPGWARAGEEAPSLEQLVVETADTREEHAALARYYHGKADHARAEASRHQSMGRAYVGGKSTQGRQFQNHCRKLSEELEAMAREYEAMAKLHEAEAKQPE